VGSKRPILERILDESRLSLTTAFAAWQAIFRLPAEKKAKPREMTPFQASGSRCVGASSGLDAAEIPLDQGGNHPNLAIDTAAEGWG